MDTPTIDHRGPEFAQLGREVLEGCKALFRTKNPVVIYPSSGTGALEAAIANTLCRRRQGVDGRDRALRSPLERARREIQA
jgi:aspartate aminotransferase-like enzyme